jgi:hypothetical protein
MILETSNTSFLIPSQIPEFIRDSEDYQNFVAFIQAYYEWMEQQGNATYQGRNLLDYDDIDETTNDFLQYYVNDFLPYFPQDALADKKKAIKIARELYKTKGTPASYQFLFRALYNSDFDVFYTRDAVLRVSDGTWFVPKSLRLATTDENFLNTNNLRVFGETTKSIATIENSVVSGNKIEIFISNIERLFQSGETVRIVDNNNQDLYFYNNQIVPSTTPGSYVLRAKIVGQISQIKINPNKRGSLYATGYPVAVYGGLNANSNTQIGAVATVGDVTAGFIQRISVINGGWGYNLFPNTQLILTNAPTANAMVASVNPDVNQVGNVAFIPTDSIMLKKNMMIGNTRISSGANTQNGSTQLWSNGSYGFANAGFSNANTTLINAFSFISFSTYPISGVSVRNGGGGITDTPTVYADSQYPTDDSVAGINGHLASLGILAPIQISSAGVGYRLNDIITFTGGSGRGANAIVTAVDNFGAIQSTKYIGVGSWSPGGSGYKTTALPTVNVQSSNVFATGASLYVPGILGSGATFSVVSDRIGAITSFNIENYGEDYVSAPKVSLKIMDIAVSNVSLSNLPQNLDLVYQGTNANQSVFKANVQSITELFPDANPANTIYSLRVFNYNTTPDPSKPLIDNNSNISMVINTSKTGYVPNITINKSFNANGIIIYGDGTAQANATFLDGLTIGNGQYITNQGQLSSFSVLESQDYNNYTYKIIVEKEIAKYRDILLNLLHPSGTKLIGVYALKSNNNVDLDMEDALDKSVANLNVSFSMVSSFTNKSNNIIKYNNIGTSNIANFITPNSVIKITPTNGPNVISAISTINVASNTITLKSNVWLTYGNVANIKANSNSNVINIVSITNSYNVINNGQYSNTAYPLMDIVFVGDTVLIDNNIPLTVNTINYVTGTIVVSGNIANSSISMMSVSRKFTASNGQIMISNPS